MPIKIKVDVTKLLKEHFFHGKERPDGTHAIYADLAILDTPDDQYGNDYRVVQDVSKEARERGEKGPIVGNGKNFGFGNKSAPKKEAAPQRRPERDPDLDTDDGTIPF